MEGDNQPHFSIRMSAELPRSPPEDPGIIDFDISLGPHDDLLTGSVEVIRKYVEIWCAPQFIRTNISSIEINSWQFCLLRLCVVLLISFFVIILVQLDTATTVPKEVLLTGKASISKMTLQHSANLDGLLLSLYQTPRANPAQYQAYAKIFPQEQQPEKPPLKYLAARVGVATDQWGILLPRVRWFHEIRGGGGCLDSGTSLFFRLGSEALIFSASTNRVRSYVVQLRTRDCSAAAAAASQLVSPTETLSHSPVQRQFLSRLGELYKKGHNCDITVECAEGKSIPFYKIVLITHSDVFEVRQ